MYTPQAPVPGRGWRRAVYDGSGHLLNPGPSAVEQRRHELERRLRVTEPVIKFLSVRTDEEQKRLDFLTTQRNDLHDAKNSLLVAIRGREFRLTAPPADVVKA